MKKIKKVRAQAQFKPRPGAVVAQQRFEALMQRLGAMSLTQARRQFRREGIPAYLYKYRRLPEAADIEAVDRLRDVLVRNQLWMANIHSLNDPFDSYVEYRVTLRGVELRRALQLFFRRTTRAVSAKADMLVNSDLVADPKKVEELMKVGHSQFLDHFGVCSLSATARGLLLWTHYADEHRGIAIQVQPARDPQELLPYKMKYEAGHHLVVDRFGGGDPESAEEELLGKSLEWEYEKEWRLIERGQSNVPRQLKAGALTGIILGLRVEPEGEALVDQLLQERARAGLPMPRTYRVAGGGRGQRLRIVRR